MAANGLLMKTHLGILRNLIRQILRMKLQGRLAPNLFNLYVQFDLIPKGWRQFPGSTLAELYDPNKMPDNLREAHRANDLAVERCYRAEPFTSDEERLAYLFKLYEEMIAAKKEKERHLICGAEEGKEKQKQELKSMFSI